MPIINLTPLLNTQGRLGEIPLNTVQDIYNQSEGALIQLGNALVTVRVVSLDPFGRFSGDIHTFSLSESMRTLAEQNMDSIYQHLWYYRGELGPRIGGPEARLQSLLDRIEECNFVVNQENYSPSAAEYLTCPITLSIPERGVFARTSLQSDVCCLYDSAALKEMVFRRQPHPVSREVMTEAHIIPKEHCYFDPERQCFHSASE